MLELNEDLILEVYNVRWLIWVQLLVTFLLLYVLFCGFSIFSRDLSKNSTCSSASASTSTPTPTPTPTPTSSTSRNHSPGKKLLLNGSASLQVEGIHRVQHDIDASTSKGSDREGSLERKLSTRDAALFTPFGRAEHNSCGFFGLAKQAILKCLGLDALLESSHKRTDREDD